MTNQRPKAYSYIRFSSPEQARGDSGRRQLEAAKAYALKHDLDFAERGDYTFLDSGLSAFKGRHLDDESQLKRFLDLVEEGAVTRGSFLLIESLDRLSREKVSRALPRFMDLLNKGIVVVTLADEKVYTEDFNELDLIISIVHMSRAHNESSLKSERVTAAWRQKQHQAREFKRPLGKACPYWLKIENGAYEPVAERVAVVEKIFELAIAGYGAAKIVRLLNNEKIPVFGSPKRNKTGAWSGTSVKRILSNRAVLGEYQPTELVQGKRVASGEPIDEFYPKVISDSSFSLAQAARHQRRLSGTTKQSDDFNVWQGIARCYECSSAMHQANKGQNSTKYLECYSAKKGTCDAKLVRLDQSEEVFREVLVKADALSLIQDNSASIARRLEAKEAELQELTEKLTKSEGLLELYASETLARSLQELEKKVEKVKSEREVLMAESSINSITSKEDFFKLVDLHSYEGRYRANLLLKRLGLYAYFHKERRKSFFCAVSFSDSSPKTRIEDYEDAVEYIAMYTQSGLLLANRNHDVLQRSFEQGEISQTEFEILTDKSNEEEIYMGVKGIDI